MENVRCGEPAGCGISAERKPQLRGQIDLLAKALDEQSATINILNERLAAVSRDDPTPPGSPSEKAVEAALVPSADYVRSRRYHAERNTRMLSDIINRLEA